MTPRGRRPLLDLTRRLASLRRDRLRVVERGPGAGLRIRSGDASAPYADGTNELAVQEAVVGRLRPGDTFFDVGANVGFFALLAARRVGPAGAVVAFEAVPHIADRVTDHARANGFTNVRVLPVAVGARPGRATLHLTRHPGGATLVEGSGSPDVVGERTVEVVTLDDAIREYGLPEPDLVKVDVEGVEDAVLDGSELLLRRRRPALVVELDAPQPVALDAKVTAMTARLRDVGYSVTRLPDSYPGADWHVAHLVADPVAESR